MPVKKGFSVPGSTRSFPPGPGTAPGAVILGGHILGEHGTQELTDLVKLRRPVACLACFGGQRRLVSRFSLELATWLATGRWTRLFKCADTEPFIPLLGDLSMPVSIVWI